MQSDSNQIKYGLNIRLLPQIDFSSIRFEKDNVETRINFSGKIIVKTISAEASKKYFKDLKNHDEFTSAHLSSIKNALLIEVPNGISASMDIESCGKKTNSFEHTIIFAGKNSRLKIVKKLKSGKTKYYSDVVEIIADENSRVDFASLQNLSKECFYFTSKKSTGKKNSKVSWIEANTGSRFTKSSVDSELEGQGAGTKNYSLYRGELDQQFDLQANAVHNARNTFSELISRGALRGKSKSVYQGNILIGKKSKNSEGCQASSAILLSKDAEADAVPKLIIENNEVKCSHKSAIGRIDEDKMIYLMSRSLSREESEKMLAEAFFEEMIAKIEDESLQNNIREQMQNE